jgi:N-acetylglucosaminyldiphosphoundecaprenol N-acetyl-beta-D-mannosaminyltransferase
VQATVKMFGMEMNRMSSQEAVAEVLRWIDEDDGTCRYVVTPNVDHAVMFQENPALRASYEEASLILADGAPVVWASHLLGRPLPERVTGSDLTPAIFAAYTGERPLKLYLLGAAPGVAQRAAVEIEKQWPLIKVVGSYSPPLGFEHNERENESIIARVNADQPDLLILGLGAPKQELWIHRHHKRLTASAALCVGATIDFLAGEKSRAPKIVQRAGLEWMHRLLSEPRRLFRRYARDAWIFPQLMWREWRNA